MCLSLPTFYYRRDTLIGDQRECIHLRLGHRDARRILSVVELGPDLKPGCRPRVPDAIHDGLVGRQRRAAPVRRDVAEEPVLDQN